MRAVTDLAVTEGWGVSARYALISGSWAPMWARECSECTFVPMSDLGAPLLMAWRRASLEVDAESCPILVSTPARLGTDGTTMRAMGGGAEAGGVVPCKSPALGSSGERGSPLVCLSLLGVLPCETSAEGAGDGRLSNELVELTVPATDFVEEPSLRLVDALACAAALRRSCSELRGAWCGPCCCCCARSSPDGA